MGSFSLQGAFRRALRKLGLARPDASDLREDLAYKHHAFQEIAKNMSQVFWADSYEKSFSIMNIGNYSELFGRPASNLEHNNLDWLEAVHPEDRPRIEAALPRQLTGRFDEVYRVIHSDGSMKWLRDRAFLIPDRDGQRKLRAGIVEDVTTSVLAEEQLRHDSKMRAMGSIAGGISHDFNNILAIIQGNLELAGLDLTSENAPGHLNTALEAATRGASLTHRLLAYARRQPLSPVSIDPTALLKDITGLLKSALGVQAVVRVATDEDVWNCRADLRQFETVLLNLAINARDATPEGGEITLRAFNTTVDANAEASELSPGEYVCFVVKDDGVGMPPEIVAQAFEPYFTTKEAGKGSGLGLSMAYGFAKQSGGHIRIDSTPGLGTTVEFRLPRDQTAAVPAVIGAQPTDHGALAGQSILVVEDEDAVRAVVTAHLKGFGCTVADVASAKDALVLCRSQARYDFLLTDMVLTGGMGGRKLATLVRSCVPEIGVVYMSGDIGEVDAEDGDAEHSRIMLRKPFAQTDLSAALIRAKAQKEAAQSPNPDSR